MELIADVWVVNGAAGAKGRVRKRSASPSFTAERRKNSPSPSKQLQQALPQQQPPKQAQQQPLKQSQQQQQQQQGRKKARKMTPEGGLRAEIFKAAKENDPLGGLAAYDRAVAEGACLGYMPLLL